MEQGIRPPVDAINRVPSARGGFMLVTVLIITAVALLFGAGALLLFRYQCQVRIDRQHELEKVYAVRSALNYTRTCLTQLPEDFKYHTWSGRDLSLVVKPVEAIFPDLNNAKHFAMQRQGDFRLLLEQYNNKLDYEYGVLGTNLVAKSIWGRSKDDIRLGLSFGDLNAKTNVKWWVNIGMRDTGGWLQEAYGRRYYFLPWTYVDGDVGGVKDVIRLCIIRNVTNELNDVGCRHGWPLSKYNERALVFQISPKAGGIRTAEMVEEVNNAEMTLCEYVHRGAGVIEKKMLICQTNTPSLCNMGMQIAHDKISIFYISNKAEISSEARGYTFSETVAMTPDTYHYFAEPVEIGNRTYGGIWTNDYGEVRAPELRAVFEVEAVSNKRREGATIEKTSEDLVTNFRVTPAYQYDVFLEHPAGVTNRATVAQKIGEWDRKIKYASFTVLTYDTHGTEHKGFRQDEREHARNGK